jgi:competence protein ComEA
MPDPAQGATQSSARSWSATLVAVLMGALGLGGGLLLRQPAEPAPVIIQAPPTATAAAPTATAVSRLVVFVSGAVQTPGVYQLPPGARVADALAAAGGLTTDANPSAVNQAAPVHDGDQVHIPTQTEAPADPPAGVRGSAGADAASGVNQLVNVNTAGQTALEGLPGIGPAKAADIIAHRPYATVDDLLRVPGIGPATLERLRPHVTTQ